MCQATVKKSVLGVIPARGGSKGVPKKNLRLVANEPLITYAIGAAKKSTYIDHLIVSTGAPPSLSRPTIRRRFTSEGIIFLNPWIAATTGGSSALTSRPITLKNIASQPGVLHSIKQGRKPIAPSPPFRNPQSLKASSGWERMTAMSN